MIFRRLSEFVVLAALPVVAQAQVAGLSITNYQFVSQQRVTLTASNVTYRADLANTGGPLASVTAPTIEP